MTLVLEDLDEAAGVTLVLEVLDETARVTLVLEVLEEAAGVTLVAGEVLDVDGSGDTWEEDEDGSG